MAPRPQNQKRRPESARRANRIIQTRTLLLLGVFGVLTFVLLFTQLYRWQITEHDELQSVAVRQQTLRTTVEASRGTIYDRNGTILAMSASAEDIFISPKEIIENDQDQNLIAGGLAEILDLDPADILKKIEKTNSQYEELKKKADDEFADKVREFINENDLKGVFIRPTSKRTYPKGTLASQVIGFTNDLGGAMGLEAAYNDELTGENGMVVTARDRDGRVRLIGACLKCGGKGAATDNFHTGGIAYPLELASGRVSGPGRSNTDLCDYTRHPASGAYLPGFQIPFWPELTACVHRAMDRVPGMGYVGWDIAVTPDGPELIEGNWHWPGGNIIQFDGVGKYPLLQDCAGETDEEHPH